ncbi:hypothetical protein COZ82_00530 [Candidatus Kaiserbacteria bacterium CG_4_8_14_3_um_filter_38_9]|uniref:Uncharacterized protein n=1 Tax=Candidatus Kaiserbacteria bacterium CG_4_8_14_3_um_filter_38_9 TaxID=1974599 RepID=A0A2M7IPI9_9BACT|nr:MAG: hypothetical protein COZ82_00530 [Candidatus Kaiserbacteria bacterium CG_4_8_14_3_um_filter_38_9]
MTQIIPHNIEVCTLNKMVSCLARKARQDRTSRNDWSWRKIRQTLASLAFDVVVAPRVGVEAKESEVKALK